MNNALDNLEYMNTELIQENEALTAQLKALKDELKALKEQALFVRDCEGEPVIETIEINGWQAKIFHDLENTFRFEIYNADCDYIESEGGFKTLKNIIRVVTDLLHLYSEFKADIIAPAGPEDTVINLKAWIFEVETETNSTLVVPAENYVQAQDKLYEIYDKMTVSFDNRYVRVYGSEHNIKSVRDYTEHEAVTDLYTADALQGILEDENHKKTLDNLGDK